MPERRGRQCLRADRKQREGHPDEAFGGFADSSRADPCPTGWSSA